MMVCEECGFQNDDGDQFCGSCQKFLGYWGAKVETAAAVTPTAESDDDESERFKTVKQAMAVDAATLAHQDAETARVADDDAKMAAAVVARKLADDAAAAQLKADREAAARLADVERQQAEAKKAAAQAELELEQLQAAKELEAERQKLAAERAEAEAKRLLDQQVQAAEAKARADAAAAQEAAEAQFAEQQRAAEAARVDAAAVAERARLAEEAAQRESEESQRRLEEAAAAAAAAALRASQEHDALASAAAAKEASEAEAARARAEIAAAGAKAAEEIARAKAELEKARAETAELRSRAESEAARSELDKQRAQAEQAAADDAARARRLAEEEAAAKRQRDLAAADAAATRKAAEAEAAEKRAQAELMTRQAEEKAAAARAEAERARAAAEAEENKRKKAAALAEAERLLAPPTKPVTVAETPIAPVSDSGKKKGGKVSSTAESPKPGPTSTGDTGPVRPKGGDRIVPPRNPVNTSEPLNPGDLVCPKCGKGNSPTRKFCRSCAEPLKEAVPVKLGFFARIKAKRRLKRELKAGTRPGGGGSGGRGDSMRDKGREGWWRLNAILMRVGALLGIVALLGFGVEPIRAKLQLPNVRQTIFDKIKGLKPVYDPVRAVQPTASSSVKGSEADHLIDLTTASWMAAPAPNSGVGQWVSVVFEKPIDLSRVLLTSGLKSDQPGETFTSQPRPRELRAIFNDDQSTAMTVGVKDIADAQTLKINHKDVTTLRLEITGVYSASDGKGKSVSISEIEFFQRRKLGDDYETLQPPTFAGDSAAGGQGVGAVTDDDLNTPWILAAPADGSPPRFTVTFATPTDIDRIRIAPGQAEATFQSNPRPREVQFAFTCEGRCDAAKHASLKDEPGFHNIGVKATGVTKIDVVIESSFGDGPGGPAIAEIQFQRKRPKVE